MSRRRHLLAAAGGLAAALLVAALPAGAATKRFRPLAFTLSDSSVNAARSPLAIGGTTTAAPFTAPLRLPPGATITGVRAYSSGLGGRVVQIAGVQAISGPVPTIVAQLVSSTVTPGNVPVGETATLNPLPAARVVSPALNYLVQVVCDANSFVWAVDVDYTR